MGEVLDVLKRWKLHIGAVREQVYRARRRGNGSAGTPCGCCLPTAGGVGRQNLARAPISNLGCVLEFLWLLLTTVLAWARPRHDLVLENLLLRHRGVRDFGGLGSWWTLLRARPSLSSDKSEWLCASMNPGHTTRPLAVMRRRASVGERSPIAAMRVPAMPTSARTGATPLPSMTVPPKRSRSKAGCVTAPECGEGRGAGCAPP